MIENTKDYADIRRKKYGEAMDRRKEQAMAALLECPTHTEAAEAAGISQSTLRKYLRDPDFKAEYERKQKDLVSSACDEGKKSLHLAISTLRAVCKSTDDSAQTRVQAARSLLDYTIKLIEIADLDERITTLEKEREKHDQGF